MKELIKWGWEILRREGFWAFILAVKYFVTVTNNPRKQLWLLTNRLLGLDNYEAVATVQGSRMVITMDDYGISSDLLLDRIREREATYYFQSILKPDWVVVDIGANIGYYALMEARVVKKVIAIEPNIKSRRLLSDNILLNRTMNIEVLGWAIGDTKKIVNFALTKKLNLCRVAQNVGETHVMQVPLDALHLEPMNCIRMDVEGYEMRVLTGMKWTLSEYKPILFIELHRAQLRDYDSNIEEVLRYLETLDYRIAKSIMRGKDGPIGDIDLLRRDKKAWSHTIVSGWFFFEHKEAYVTAKEHPLVRGAD